MNKQNNHSYSYGEATDFFCVPRLIIVHETYRKLSSESKIAYALFLERMKEDSHLDELNQNYIYYPETELAEILNVDCKTVQEIFLRLDVDTGVGLIKIQHELFEHQPRIYVMKFYDVIEEEMENKPFEVKTPPTADEYHTALVKENYLTIHKVENTQNGKVISFPSKKVRG